MIVFVGVMDGILIVVVLVFSVIVEEREWVILIDKIRVKVGNIVEEMIIRVVDEVNIVGLFFKL